MRDKVFISYCHADSGYQGRVAQHFKPLERNGYLQYWSDTKLKASQKWREEIRNAIEQSVVSVLLISADFLASDFIAFEELPELLKHTKIFPVLIHPCYLKKENWLTEIQFVNDLETPLSGMTKTEQEAVWAKLTEEVMECVKEETTSQYPDLGIYQNGIVTIIEAMMPNAKKQNPHSQTIYDDTYTLLPFLNQQSLDYYLQDMIASPNLVQNYWVYEYEHIDIQEFMLPVNQILGAYKTGADIVDEIKKLFTAHGWEGDGDIRFMWFPPFLKIGTEDTWGTLAFFVKQNNNGTSFIACPEPIPYLFQSNILYPDKEGYYFTKIIEERKMDTNKYRCLKIEGLLLADQPPVENETHWLFFSGHKYFDVKAGDIVKFKPQRSPLPLRNFPDIKNTRNIYVSKLEKVQ